MARETGAAPTSMFRDGLFEGRVAVVTGGGTGIGLCIAEQLSLLGAKVVIASRNAGRLAIAARGLGSSTGVEVLPVACNVRRREDVDLLFDRALERFGSVDFVVNNGGGQFPAPAESITAKGWHAVIETNLTGTFHMCQAAAQKWMLAHGGRIVTIVADMWNGFPGMIHTGAARAGVVNLTKTLAIEWARYDILVNAVAPGVIASTGMHNYPKGVPELAQSQIPLKRLGRSVDVANAVVFLLSPGGDFITGETMRVDGGGSLWGNRWPIEDRDPMPPVEIQPWPEERWPEHVPPGDGDGEP